ncbi:MAG: restriction endonuclease subunit S [Thalassolituus oleivorans]|uniref:restriction endonuclease subunit S n=1 Tax=Thalassolituus oleivorans TaxID=187493 RepID=UPI001B3EA9F9|nr:restriction endonuclease subunit S [Thalassolituus oleivorans]MBQ0727603.1 restriction endonuclease subunit S [Thalassolituus oleivorans]MBQ0782134.1 restriction endonuclease subunit S [Thalassolituus oleivorans]
MVPEGWKLSTIEEIANVSSGGTPSRKNDTYWNGNIPWVTTAEVQFKVIKDTSEKITEEGLANSSAKLFPVDTILMAMYGQGKTRGQVAKLGIEASTNQACAAIVLHTDYEVDYYYQFLVSQYENIREMANSGGQENLSGGIVKSIQVPVPPLPEQKKIAQILSTWDKAITTTEQLLANSQQQKKALMQQLLTGKKRLLDKNEVRFSGEWYEVSLSALCQINPKKSPAPEDGKVTFIAMESVSEDAKIISSSVREYDDVSKGFTSFVNDDVLVAKITPCFENGKGAYVERMRNGIGFGSTEFHVLRSGAKSDSKYLYYLTNTSEFRVRGEANMQGSAGQKRVTTDYLKSLKVTVSTELPEQQKIAAVLSSADQEITALQQKLHALKQEKKALMQQLLTGKRRVKTEEAA